MMKNPNRPPLCKFINNCKQFKANRQCKFSHDTCKFGDRCQSKATCKFYHPEMEGTATSSPQRQKDQRLKPSQTPCRFGNTCTKLQMGMCPFNHDMPPPKTQGIQKERGPSLPRQQQQCKFGAKCNKPPGACPYKHSNVMKRQMSIQEPNNPQDRLLQGNAPAQQQMQMQMQNVNQNAQYQQYEQNRLCHNFVVGQCPNRNCELAHQLTLDNSLKRLYFRCFAQVQTFCNMFKSNQGRLFTFSNGINIGFYQLDEECQVLKTVCPNELKAQASILNLFTNIQYQGPLQSLRMIFVTQNRKIHRFHPNFGTVESNDFPGSQLICNAFYFTQNNILIIGSSTGGLYAQHNGNKREDITTKILSSGHQKFNKITTLKKNNIQGQNFIIIGTQFGYLSFINKNFDVQTIQIPQSSIIDVGATVYNDKPFAFIVVCENQKKYHILAMNLLDFSYDTVFTYELSRIRRIQCVYDRIFIAIDGVGVLIYNLPDFVKIKGRLPFSGKITNMESDSQGNLLIVESQNFQNGSSLSIYKVRK